ncbi:hypothetical protein FA15DRAFT_672408 [Coprinopsis marcescibilis]|uniref:Uncharacterized protein n=1 Tax=Coprinopsis marcescibilis TaxID=230819 RepID=A0A5C3KMH7_COPMA|nr:hypothetical protein FA15DRAFT_672408 [Coprinopsis marcescibilis]
MPPTKLLEPLRERPSKGDTALEATDLAVRTLRDIVAMAPIPFVADAAGLVLSILDTMKDIRDNKEAFKHLVDDAFRLVVTASDTCTRLKSEGYQLSQDLVMDLAKLVGTLKQVQRYAYNKVKRGFGERILFKHQDLETIRRYREELRQAMDTFSLQSTISIRHNVAEISRSQERIIQKLENQGSRRFSTGGESNHRPGLGRQPSTDPSRQRPYSTPEQHQQVPYSPINLTPSSPSTPRPISTPPTSGDYLIAHPDLWLRSQGVPILNEAAYQHNTGYTSPTSQYFPTQFHGSSPLVKQNHEGATYNINSGNTIHTITSNSHNNYGNNVYGRPPQSPQGGYWASTENWT